MSETFHRAVETDTLPDNSVVGVVINSWPVALSKYDGKLFAVVDRCTHATSPMSTGKVRRGSIMCPLHGARFDLASGKCIGAQYEALKIFETRIADGWIEVKVPDEAPDQRYIPIMPY